MKLNKISCSCMTLMVFLYASTAIRTDEPSKMVTEAENQLGPEVEGYRLSVRTEKKKYPPGEMVTVTVILKNVGKEDARLLRTKSLASYELSVILPSKQKAPPTLYGKRALADLSIFGRTFVTLKPNEEFIVSFHLSRLFDMTVEGNYKVAASTKVPKRDGSHSTTTITSNILEVAVDESAVDEAKEKGGK